MSQTFATALMARFYQLAVITTALLISLANASINTCLNGLCAVTRANLTPEQVARELGPLLSKGSSIFGPSSPRWENAMERYQTYMAPNITVVVRPEPEDEIPKIVSTRQTFGTRAQAAGLYLVADLIPKRFNMPITTSLNSSQ
jgi:hypothetical protein